MEQPDVVFSVEQIRCGQPPKRESQSLSPMSDRCDPDVIDSQAEDEGSNPDEAADLYLKLKENPEELLQLAPEPGDTIVPLIGEMDESVCTRAQLSSPPARQNSV